MPKKGRRDSAEQTRIENELKSYSLYQLAACPFCIKVRRSLWRLNLPIELRNIKIDKNRDELLSAGGRTMVPCLKIGDGSSARWMYESSDIISYLEEKYPL